MVTGKYGAGPPPKVARHRNFTRVGGKDEGVGYIDTSVYGLMLITVATPCLNAFVRDPFVILLLVICDHLTKLKVAS